MIVGLLRAAAVAALCLAAVAQPTDAKLHSSLRHAADDTPNPKNANSFIMPYKETSDRLNWNTNVLTTFGGRTQIADMQQVGINSLVLAFATGACGSENWDGLSSKALIDANRAAFSAAGFKIRLSTGGAAGKFTCGSASGFDSFVGPWGPSVLSGVDFDIEAGQSNTEIAQLVMRVKEGLAKYPSLTFTFTVAATGGSMSGKHSADPFPAGQAPNPFQYGFGTTVMKQLIAQLGFQKGNPASWPSPRVRINPMAMDYSDVGNDNCVVNTQGKCNMAQTAIQIAYNINGYWGVPMGAIELTPMIGDQDDTAGQFSVADATTVASWAKQNGLAAVHYWAYDRDIPCNKLEQDSSDTCNKVSSSEHQFINAMVAASR